MSEQQRRDHCAPDGADTRTRNARPVQGALGRDALHSNAGDDQELSPALHDAVALLRAAPAARAGALERATAAALAAQRATRGGGRPAREVVGPWTVERGGAHGARRAAPGGWRPAALAAGVLVAVGVGSWAWSARDAERSGGPRVAAARPAGARREAPSTGPGGAPDAAPAPGTNAPAGDAAPAALHALDEAPRLVRFRLRAQGARAVALVGDFNRWDRAATPLTAPDGARTGEWTADVPLTPGRHAYAFVVDGRRWVLDPAAPEERDPDFGRAHSVTVVGLAGAP